MIEEIFQKGGKIMKKIKAKSIMIASLAILLASCGSSRDTFTIGSEWNNDLYGLSGRTARTEYRYLSTSSISSLNYMYSAQAANADHFANFVDGLLLHNSYGILEQNLACGVTHDADYTTFTFTVREGVEWQNYDGTQYEATIDGVKVAQYVDATDWVASAKAICTYGNASELTYLLTTFIKGTAAYYYYTYMVYSKAAGNKEWLRVDLTDYEVVASKLNELIEENESAIWENEYDGGNNPIEAEDVEGIINFEVGITAVSGGENGGGTVTYELSQKAPYFPTLFTYSCYLPVNQYFLDDVGFSAFGTTNDKILYCGPYLLSEWSEVSIVYTANEKYWNAENVYAVDTITCTIITDTSIITDDYTRKQFESDTIDGFSLSMQDSAGWSQYITGEDGSGTFEDPASPYVNARLLDEIGNMYGSNLVLERSTCGNNTSYYSGGSASTIANATIAMRLNAVREALMNAADLNYYYDLSFDSLDESIRQQYKVYTYVPKGFVQDDDGNDYVTTEYYQVYSENTGMPVGDPDDPQEGTVAYELNPGQTETGTVSDEEFVQLLDNAKAAIDAYNETASTKISLPVQIEYYSLYYDDDSRTTDLAIIENMNIRLGYYDADGNVQSDAYFHIVPTDQVTSQNYSTVSGSSGGGAQYDISIVNWGWGADYGDPLTFLNTYHLGSGDWASIFPFVGESYVANYDSVEDEDGNFVSLAAETNLLEEYSALVDQGAAETEDFNQRYYYFAQAEYLLCEEMNFYKPQVNYGQGWSFSVSRSAAYYTPQSSYGLSSSRMTGMYVLDEVMTREDRQAARAAQQVAKEAYIETIDTSAGNSASINIY